MYLPQSIEIAPRLKCLESVGRGCKDGILYMLGGDSQFDQESFLRIYSPQLGVLNGA